MSLTFKTEQIFWRAEGEVIDRGAYRVVRTPSNPTYYNGNLLYFDHPPAPGDYPIWCELFKREFKNHPDVKHVLFIWDMPDHGIGAVAPFVEHGFEVQTNITLEARDVVRPMRINKEVEVRRIATDDEWAAVLACKIRLRDPRIGLEPYTIFKTKWLEARRALAAGGQGDWYGAFIGTRLVGDLGLFQEGTVARFQDVATEPEFRGQGVCRTLVYEVSRRALRDFGVRSPVMVADEDYHAARIYESVGFKRKERHAVACLSPTSHKAARPIEVPSMVDPGYHHN